LVPANVVAAALSAVGTTGQHAILEGLLTGSAIASWCPAGVEARLDGSDLVLSGVERPVESAAHADHLLVTARTGDGLTQVLLPADATGVRVEPMRSVDLTRRFARVTFEDVRVPADAVVGEVGGAAAEVERQLQQALVLAAAESVGAMQA